ncbi:hypothetical protein [Neorhizobium alkalisoli]|uniref:hypothetical protein n=1 Tax=Neorhizobium alkalisoli TaxID=528178 RepID=UPI000CF9F0ED|nr:hypothetical protein [Neorhizobium alkalisoli]
MQTLLLITLGLLLGSALIAGAVRLALRPPGFWRKPLMADPLDRPDLSDGAIVYASPGDCGGSDGQC